MKIYFAGAENHFEIIQKINEIKKMNILCSFIYTSEKMTDYFSQFNDVLIDSGAFTFMNQSKNSNVDFFDYANKYADFIKKKKIKRYFELDIDSIVGYEKVKEIRKLLEDKTGVKPIPVWHKSRGMDDYYKMCETYPYVAIGGIVVKEISDKYFPGLIKIAHDYKTKIHGLGFTKTQKLKTMNFDSVDSTSWLVGQRFGETYHFDGKNLNRIYRNKNQKMILSSKESSERCLMEWIKYAEYLESR